MTERIAPGVVAQVDQVFADRVTAGTAPSSVWGVFDADGLVASGGHGDRGDGRAPDADTAYRIASCTKSVTAATLLGLAADGLVDLDAPVTDHVPAFTAVALPTRDSPVPTLRMLLTMSGGLPTDDPWADRQESMSDDELDRVLRDGLLFDSVPGTRFAYSNTGYALLGRVVTSVTGRPFTEVATERVLDPLGLRSTRFGAADLDQDVVVGARRHAGSWEPLPLTGPGAFSPIGGLFSTVTDLSRWATYLAAAFHSTPSGHDRHQDQDRHHEHQHEHASTDPVRAVDRRLMQQAMRMIPGAAVPSTRRQTGYGFGLFVEDAAHHGPIASHSGGYPGFSAHMRWSVTTGLGVVAFENATQAKVATAAETAHDLVLDAAPSPDPLSAVLPETRAAQRAVTALLATWAADTGTGPTGTDALAILAPNVAMDTPLDRRRAAVTDAVRETGADLTGARLTDAHLTGAPLTAALRREVSYAPTHLRWWIPGDRGALRVEIRLAPLARGVVQTLTVVAEPRLVD